jgi:hypothetical protein
MPAGEVENGATDPHAQYHIAKSETDSVDLQSFLRPNGNDPATKVSYCFKNLNLVSRINIFSKGFLMQLKTHLLPRLQELLHNEMTQIKDAGGPDSSSRIQAMVPNNVYLKNDRLYRHKTLRINYTTYDVRRDSDVVNPDTGHCNVMLLSAEDESSEPANHPFLYARILGIFHANVIYVGAGSIDYKPRRIEFLWVRWYRLIDSDNKPKMQNSGYLRRLSFPPMTSDDAFGFINPADVLRASYIVPRISQGQVHFDGIGISRHARDSEDWKMYFVIQ